jgi:hypothetical protein
VVIPSRNIPWRKMTVTTGNKPDRKTKVKKCPKDRAGFAFLSSFDSWLATVSLSTEKTHTRPETTAKATDNMKTDRHPERVMHKGTIR